MSRQRTRATQTTSVLLSYEGKAAEAGVPGPLPQASLREMHIPGSSGRPPGGNLLVEGDNLAVLGCLLRMPDVAGHVRLVYIDPPFASGQRYRAGGTRIATVSASADDPVAYEDHLRGGDFLEFLRRRLIPLREILADDGSIYLHIDGKMGHYVKVLMDEIFGKEQFINDITRIKCNPKNFSRRGYGNVKDMILFYSKSRRFLWNEPRVGMTEEELQRLFPKVDKEGRRYTTTPLHAPGETKHGATGKSWNGTLPPKGRHWRVPPKELERLDALALIEWSDSGNPRKKIFADDVAARGKKLQDVWEFKDPPYPEYPTEKNRDLVKQIIQASSNPGDLVLDCFAGSGTTLLAADELGRQWIGIDRSKTAIRTMQRRLHGLASYRLFQCLESPLPSRRRVVRSSAGRTME